MLVSLEIVLAIFTLFILVIFLSRWSATQQTNPKKLPPSPRKLPIIGNLHQLGSYPHRSLRSLAQKHGSLMLLHLGRVPVVIASSADAAKEIMKTHDLIFSNRPNPSIPRRLLYDTKDIAFAPYGEYWRQAKSIAVLQLLSNKRVQSFRNIREEETTLMMEKISDIMNSSGSSLINLSKLCVTLTNDVICRAALGRKYGVGKFSELLGEFVELLGVFAVGDYIPWLSWVDWLNGIDGRVEKVAKGFDDFLEDVIKEKMERRGGETLDSETDGGLQQAFFVDILLEVQKQDNAGQPIHKETIKAVILDMFAAGTDTTFSLIEWTISELIRNPEVMKKLQNEVREIARGRPTITEEDLEKMQYLKAVVKETMRLHPPVPLLIPRESTQDIEVMGYHIIRGTRVFVNAWAIGRDPLVWEEPDEFRPERFLTCSIDFKGFHYELIPFGAGRRGCPGASFAISTIELALANVVCRFDLALPGGRRGQDLDMNETTGITVHRKSPLVVIATKHAE